MEEEVYKVDPEPEIDKSTRHRIIGDIANLQDHLDWLRSLLKDIHFRANRIEESLEKIKESLK